MWFRFLCCCLGFAAFASQLTAELRLVPIVPPELWSRAEWRVAGAPVTSNNFDPDLIRIDAFIVTPSQRKLTVPAFWFQDYTRALVDGAEALAPVGFTPDEPGAYELALVAVAAGRPRSEFRTRFTVPPAPERNQPGWVREAADHRYLETTTGRPLRFIGSNVAWAGPRGTYDYDEWFAAMRESGQNLARLWFAPWSMALEQKPGTLGRYDLAAAWQMDHVLRLAEHSGIHVILTLDPHGMFLDGAFGGDANRHWVKSSPYSVHNGGLCAKPNDFFTSPKARHLYQKRLRYLVARYGGNPWLAAWQLCDAIDRAYPPGGTLADRDVVAWHRLMGQWLRANDPYRHLVSTGLGPGSDRADYWTMPEMDFSTYQSYGEADPARALARHASDLARRYQKPALVAEFGTSSRDWAIAGDPHLRGFRQGLWAGVLGGAMGTALPWWWREAQSDGALALFAAVRTIMHRAGWERSGWRPARLLERGPAPAELGEAPPRGEPFTADIPLNPRRFNPGGHGQVAIGTPLGAARAAERLSAYLHGGRHPYQQQHARLNAWFADGGRLALHVNSVAATGDLVVRIDNVEKFRATLVNKDGIAALNDEIDREFTVDVPSGRHRLELSYTADNWVNLKSIRLERVRPAPFAGGWEYEAEAVGLRRDDTVVVYLRSPHIAWPAGALRYNPPVVRGATVTVLDWPVRPTEVIWYDPRTGMERARAMITKHDGQLALAAPDFTEDLVAVAIAKERTAGVQVSGNTAARGAEDSPR